MASSGEASVWKLQLWEMAEFDHLKEVVWNSELFGRLPRCRKPKAWKYRQGTSIFSNNDKNMILKVFALPRALPSIEAKNEEIILGCLKLCENLDLFQPTISSASQRKGPQQNTRVARQKAIVRLSKWRSQPLHPLLPLPQAEGYWTETPQGFHTNLILLSLRYLAELLEDQLNAFASSLNITH